MSLSASRVPGRRRGGGGGSWTSGPWRAGAGDGAESQSCGGPWRKVDISSAYSSGNERGLAQRVSIARNEKMEKKRMRSLNPAMRSGLKHTGPRSRPTKTANRHSTSPSAPPPLSFQSPSPLHIRRLTV